MTRNILGFGLFAVAGWIATAAIAGRGQAQQDPRAAIFVQRGCQECHAIAALRVKAATDVGPDLTFAYADVVNRYGTTLPSFFAEPPGVMGLVLASHMHLTRADRDSISRILRAVYEEHLAEMNEEIPSLPPGRARPRTRPATADKVSRH
jgi:hypothetical protein